MAVQPYGEDDYAAVLEAMRANGGEILATEARNIMGISDRRNLARAMQRGIELELFHRHQRGPRVSYILGPDPHANDLVGDFRPTLHGDDFTLELHNCPMSQNDVPILNKAQVLRLKRLLNGIIE
jgi:hypothetical protein